MVFFTGYTQAIMHQIVHLSVLATCLMIVINYFCLSTWSHLWRSVDLVVEMTTTMENCKVSKLSL